MPKAYTNEQFLERLHNKFPHIKALEKYKGGDTKIKFKCLKDGYTWETTPYVLLHSKFGCWQCKSDHNTVSSKRITKEQFEKELYKKFPYIRIIGKYKNKNTKTTFTCLRDKCTWETTPYNLIKSKWGCPICRKKGISKYHKAYKKDTSILQSKRKRFLKRLKETSSFILPKSLFYSMSQPMNFLCTNCDTLFITTPQKILHRKTKCPNCHKQGILLPKQENKATSFDKKLKKKFPSIIRIGKFVNLQTPTKFKCLKGQETWQEKPYNLLHHKQGCPFCSQSNTIISKTNEILKKEHIKALSKFKNGKDVVKFMCLNCGFKWSTRLNNILYNHTGCANCSKKASATKRRKSNKQFADELRKINPSVKLISDYKGNKYKVTLECTICKYKWQDYVGNILNKHTNYYQAFCPNCRFKQNIKHPNLPINRKRELFYKYLNNPYIYSQEKINKLTDRITFHCSLCKYTWSDTPINLLRNPLCPNCKSKNQKSTNLVKQIYKKHPNLRVLSFKGRKSGKKAKLICIRCGYKWSRKVSLLLRDDITKEICPYCSSYTSQGEYDIQKFLESHHIKYQYAYTSPKLINPYTHRRLHIDFKIGKLLIEYQGAEHYPSQVKGKGHFQMAHTINITMKHDAIKKKWAAKHGYILIHIRYDNNTNQVMQLIYNTFLKDEKRKDLVYD